MRSEVFWRDIYARVHAAARAVAIRSNVLSSTDHEDLAQNTMIELQQFVEERLAQEPDLSIADLRKETLAVGGTALQHNFLDLVRKIRRREVKTGLLAAGSNEREAFIDTGRQRASTPEERAIVIDWIDRMRARTTSPRMHKVLDACAVIAKSEVSVMPKDLSQLSGVNDLHKFRVLARELGLLPSKGGK